MEMQVHRIHRVVHEVHHGHDLSKKVYLALTLVRDQFVRHRHEKIQMYPHIAYGLVQWRVIHRMIQRHARGSLTMKKKK